MCSLWYDYYVVSKLMRKKSNALLIKKDWLDQCLAHCILFISSCIRLIIATQKATCWNCANSRPGSAMPDHTDLLAVLLGRPPKFHAPVCSADRSKLAIDSATRDTEKHRIWFIISLKGLVAGKRSRIISYCKFLKFLKIMFSFYENSSEN
jgi:hypothetical protein